MSCPEVTLCSRQDVKINLFISPPPPQSICLSLSLSLSLSLRLNYYYFLPSWCVQLRFAVVHGSPMGSFAVI